MKKFFFKIRRCFISDSSEKISRSERYTTMIALNLLKLPDTELLIHPSKDKYYIHSGDDEILMIISPYPANVTLINHRFQYNITYGKRSMDILQTRFLEETEKRRDKFEKKFLDNTENFLRSIALSIMK